MSPHARILALMCLTVLTYQYTSEDPILTSIFNELQNFISYECQDTLPLLQDHHNNFFISVPYTRNSGTSYLNLIVNLYSNISFIGNCSEFIKFECHYPGCIEKKSIQTNSHFLLQNTNISSNTEVKVMNLGNRDTKLQDTFFFPNSCGKGFMKDELINGIYSMGISSSDREIQNFTVIFHKNGYKGKHLCLKPKIDFRLRNGSPGVIINKTTNSWSFETRVVWIDTPIALTNDIKPYTTIFDINTPYIGLPNNLYRYVMTTLKKYFSVRCNITNSKEYCYTTQAGALPTLHLQISENDSIDMPAISYLMKETSTRYRIAFASVGPNESSDLVVNPEYANHIILGAPFFQEYMPQFMSYGNTSKIVLYRISNIQDKWVLPFFATIMMVIALWMLGISLKVMIKDTRADRQRRFLPESRFDSFSTQDRSDYQELEDNESESSNWRKNCDTCCFFTGVISCCVLSAIALPAVAIFFFLA